MSVSFSFITPRLATGGGVTDVTDVEALAKAGISHILDVTDAEDDSSLLLADHSAIVYSYNPTADDGTPKGADWFSKTLAFTLPVFAIPHARVYCHCSAGVNRGPSSAFVTMRALGWSSEVALALIKEKRPQAEVRYFADANSAIAVLGYE